MIHERDIAARDLHLSRRLFTLYRTKKALYTPEWACNVIYDVWSRVVDTGIINTQKGD